MKKIVIKNRRTNDVLGEYDSKQLAVEEMMDHIEENNSELKESDDTYLTPFDFSMETTESIETNELIPDYEAAINNLGMMPAKNIAVNPSHKKALEALNELFTIAEAWNKEDGFVPDFSDRNQIKWFPWFVYSDNAAGFVYATHNAASSASAYYGSRLCFKSSARARQFGEQFIGLWNKVLLLGR